MIIFLTLVYVAALALAVWLGWIKLNLWWKLSPIAWFLLLNVVLFIPMQWGAPAGHAVVFRPVVEIVPNVSGEVTEVTATGMRKMQEGDVLFRIDPTPYQSEVDRLRAALKAAEQKAAALPEQLKAADAVLAQAKATLVDAQQQEGALQADVELAQATVDKTKADAKLAEVELERREGLAKTSPGVITQEELQEMRAKKATADASVAEAEAKLKQAKLALDARVGNETTAVATAREQIKSAEAAKREAELALSATIDGENVEVVQFKAQLAKAKFDLEETTVTAPSDGYPLAVTLRPGDRVSSQSARSWMAFVRDETPDIGVGIPQYALRHVKPGQDAEVVFKAYPGQTFAAKVERIGYMTAEGQIAPDGSVAFAPDATSQALPFAVVLSLKNAPDAETLPGGAVGTAAIYTDRAKPTHLIRMTMLRMQSWMNYVLP